MELDADYAEALAQHCKAWTRLASRWRWLASGRRLWGKPFLWCPALPFCSFFG